MIKVSIRKHVEIIVNNEALNNKSQEELSKPVTLLITLKKITVV